MSKSWRNVGFVVVVLAVLAAAAGWALRPVVITATAKRGRVVDAVPATISVRAEYLMELRTEVAGRVAHSALAVGRALQGGEELLRIDDAELRMQVDALQRDLQTAVRRADIGFPVETQLVSAREALAKAERAAQSGGIAPAELAQQRRAVQQLEQQLALDKLARQGERDALETAWETKRRELEKTRLVAPAAGKIVEVLARPGDLLAAGAVVARVLSETRVVEAKIAEENFASVRAGQSASVRFLTYGHEQFPATVTAILPVAEADTRRYTAQLAVEVAPERLVPGLSGEALIIVGVRENVVVVPRRALAGDEVRVLENGRVRVRKVSRGFGNLAEVQIVDGVKEGEVVIVESPETFRDGERVRVRGN